MSFYRVISKIATSLGPNSKISTNLPLLDQQESEQSRERKLAGDDESRGGDR